MTIEKMSDLQALVPSGVTDWQRYGDVKAVEKDGLIKFMYTHHAVKNNRWNWLERNARGMILHRETGAVVAWPFEKFFSWGERGRTTDAPMVSISEKMDGSLGIIHANRDGKPWRCVVTTKGSFDSEQAQWATDYAQRVGLLAPRGVTAMVEIIYPGNRILVDYGAREGLVLIGARCNETGRMYSRGQLQVLGAIMRDHKCGVLPLAPDHPQRPVSELLRQMSEDTSDREGVVAEFADGQRFKLKTSRYIEAHKAASSLTPEKVAKIWLKQGWRAINRIKVSSISRNAQDIQAWEALTQDLLRQHKAAARDLASQIPHLEDASDAEKRKTAAMWIKQQPAKYQPMLFAKLSGKSMSPALRGLVAKEVARATEEDE